MQKYKNLMTTQVVGSDWSGEILEDQMVVLDFNDKKENEQLQAEYKVDKVNDTESIQFKTKTKNNNSANDTFAANHVTYLSESQLNWKPSVDNFFESLYGKREDNIREIEARQINYFKKQFSYKDGNTLYITIDRPFPYLSYDDNEDRVAVVGFMTSTEQNLDGFGILVTQKDNKLVIELVMDVDPKLTNKEDKVPKKIILN